MSKEKRSLQRFRDAHDPCEQSQAWLEAGRLVARQGDLEEARRLLRAAVEADPGCTEAWLQLVWLTEDPRERKALLRQVLAQDPNHVQAQAEWDRLVTSPTAPSPAPTPPSSARKDRPERTRLWVLGGLVLAAAVLLAALLVWGPVDRSLAGLLPTPTPVVTPMPTLAPPGVAAQFEPQLQAALSAEDWDRALEIVAIMLGIDPAGEAVQHWAQAAHMQYGQYLVEEGQVDEALRQFDQSVSMVPDDAEARLWQQVTQIYLAGQAAFKTDHWSAAVQNWTDAYARMPDYGDLFARMMEAYDRQTQAAIEAGDWTAAIKSLSEAREWAPHDSDLVGRLAAAYRQRGIAWQEEGNLEKARTDLEAALALRPDDEEAQVHYDEVMYILFPPKRIEISISRQRFYAYQGDTLVYSFPTSTGLRGRDTKAGHFKVQSKIPMAYSSIWRLQMPYWLGIYWVGNIENGIHALPIRPDGSVMWGGLLGQRASYGCVILSTQAARTIYNWVDIGTPVDIYW
jgi:tetratricopeptide (TPR) repeat protein